MPARRFSLRRALTSVFLVLLCSGMAAVQLWRAQTRGALYLEQQTLRAATPLALTAATRTAPPLLWRKVQARGHWLAAQTFFLDNKIYRSRVGYQVITPLQLDNSEAVVLVNRGWIAAPPRRSELPVVDTPSGTIAVHGTARGFETRYFAFGEAAPEGRVWQHLGEADYRQRSGLDILPVILLQDAPDDTLRRDWSEITAPQNPAGRHYGYAAMWVLFALMALIYSLTVWRQNESLPPPDH